jgi:hypothetical protein
MAIASIAMDIAKRIGAMGTMTTSTATNRSVIGVAGRATPPK